jgi:hypothetical protein
MIRVYQISFAKKDSEDISESYYLLASDVEDAKYLSNDFDYDGAETYIHSIHVSPLQPPWIEEVGIAVDALENVRSRFSRSLEKLQDEINEEFSEWCRHNNFFKGN